MSRALSPDLRHQTLAAGRWQEEDLTRRAAAARFKVSAASVGRWPALPPERRPRCTVRWVGTATAM